MVLGIIVQKNERAMKTESHRGPESVVREIRPTRLEWGIIDSTFLQVELQVYQFYFVSLRGQMKKAPQNFSVVLSALHCLDSSMKLYIFDWAINRCAW